MVAFDVFMIVERLLKVKYPKRATFSTSPRNDIALVVGDLSEGGAQRVVCNLANSWSGAGRNVAVITLANKDKDFFKVSPTVLRHVVAITENPCNFFLRTVTSIRRLIKLRVLIRNSGAPIIVAFVGSTNILTIVAAVGLKVRVVISERNDPSLQQLDGIWNILRKLLYRYADLVTANSYAALRALEQYVPVEKLAYVPNPLLQPDPVPEKNCAPVILNVGRLHPQKGQNNLISAFALVAENRPGWRLLIAGTGNLEASLKTHALSLGLQDRVVFLGQVDPWPYYANASIFALASRFEGTPNALLEAMSMGVPPVITDMSGDSTEFVKDGISGLVVPGDDIIMLSHALKKLMDSESLRDQLGKAAKILVAKNEISHAILQWETLLFPRAIKAR